VIFAVNWQRDINMATTSRIFALSDTHLASWPTVPANVDLILFGGDFYDCPMLAGLGDDPDDADANRFLFPDATAQAERKIPPILAVRGNHDWLDPFGFFAKGRDISGKAVLALPGLIVVGIGLAHRNHVQLPTELEVEQVCRSAQQGLVQVRNSQPDAAVILLSHYPGKQMVTPAEAATPGWAFDCVDRFAAELGATVIIAGHVHEAFARPALQPNVLMPGPAGTVIELPLQPI
jgi:Icc-related predicted phosphoesterase